MTDQNWIYLAVGAFLGFAVGFPFRRWLELMQEREVPPAEQISRLARAAKIGAFVMAMILLVGGPVQALAASEKATSAAVVANATADDLADTVDDLKALVVTIDRRDTCTTDVLVDLVLALSERTQRSAEGNAAERELVATLREALTVILSADATEEAVRAALGAYATASVRYDEYLAAQGETAAEFEYPTVAEIEKCR